MLKGNINNSFVLNKIEVALGWDANPSTCHVVSCKLRDEGLHIFLGVVGFCMKDNGEDPFKSIYVNVFVDDMNEGNDI